MIRKVTKFLVVIVVALMLLTPPVMGLEIQTWGTPGGIGSTYYVGINDKGLFCTNHGYMFLSNRDYRVYETGTVDHLPLKRGHNGDGGLLISFIIGDMQRAVKNGEHVNNVITRNGQPWQEWIWELLGENVQSPNASVYANLEAKYQEYKDIYAKKDENVTIDFSSDVAVANEHKMIGPFTINYNYKEKIDEYIDLKIIMTDNATGTEKVLFEKVGNNTSTNIITSDAERK